MYHPFHSKNGRRSTSRSSSALLTESTTDKAMLLLSIFLHRSPVANTLGPCSHVKVSVALFSTTVKRDSPDMLPSQTAFGAGVF